MIRINIHEAKANLSKYLARLEKGEVVVICKRNVPVAELRPISRPAEGRRRVGFLRAELQVPPSFFEPLSPDVLDSFEGLPASGARP